MRVREPRCDLPLLSRVDTRANQTPNHPEPKITCGQNQSRTKIATTAQITRCLTPLYRPQIQNLTLQLEGFELLLVTMHVATFRLCAILGGLAGYRAAPSIREDHNDDPIDPTQAGGAESLPSCRVAVSISGDVRSFVDPAVHRSIRRYVVEPMEEINCQVDVFAYAMLEDDLDLLLEVRFV